MSDEPLRVRSFDVADLHAVVDIHAAAFPGAALTKFGREAVRRYYAWQLTGPHDAVALAAIADGEMAGFCIAGRFRGALSGFLSRNRAFLTWRIVTHPWLLSNEIVRGRVALGLKLLSQRRLPGQPQQSELVRRSFGILSIAVHPSWQGRHAGSLLMKAAEIAARERGFDAMHLTVAPDNVHAVKFYEHLDWRRVSQEGEWRGAMRKPLH